MADGVWGHRKRGGREAPEHWTGPQVSMTPTWHACYSANAPDAHVVKGFLEQRGVPCLLRQEGPTMYPSAAFGMRVHVLVPEDWLQVARKMVDRRRRAKPARVVPLRPRRRRA